MTEKTYQLHIHDRRFDRKPSKKHIPSINASITKKSTAVTQQQLAELVGQEGRTMVLGLMEGKERKKHNVEKQQVVAIDFDNTVIVNKKKKKTTGDQYTSVEDILNDPFAKEQAAFLYKTFSDSEDWERFRLVFFLDYPLTNNKQVELLYRWLMKKYPNADKSNKDSSRLFFGGTEYEEIKFGNELKTTEVEVDPSDLEDKPTIETPTKIEPISDRDAKQMFREYVKRDRDNLREYDNALSVIWVLAKSVKLNEITTAVAYECAEILALDNEEWKQNNKKKLVEALYTDLKEFHTTYTFSQKFGYGTHIPESDDIIQISKQLVEKMSIVLYKGQLYFKQDNRWITDRNKMLRAVDEFIELKSSQDKELIQQFMKRAELNEEEHFPVQFRNNYMFENGKIINRSTEKFTPYFLDVEYNEKAYSKDVDEFLDFLTCERKDLRRVIEDMLGHMLMTKGFPHKVFFFVGEKGANGKSTFLEMLNNFAGDLRTNISLENFNDATSVVDLEGKLVNIGDDIDASYLESSSNFKILASGNTIVTRPIYATPYRLKNKATLIFTANDMPTFKDKTGGIARRLVIIPCDNVVKKTDFEIDEKLSTEEAKSYLLNLAIQGMKRIGQNGGRISKSKTIESLVSNYIKESNSALMYLDEEVINEDLSATMVYKDYQSFCRDYGYKPYSKTKFTQILKDHGYEKVRKMRMGKREFYYVKEEE